MPTEGLDQFVRDGIAARDEALELGRKALGEIAAFSHREVIALSPVADPDAPGSGRLRASWTMKRGEADEQFADLTGGSIPPPDESVTQAVADSVQLGDEIWIANGSPCVSTVNDRTSFVDQAIAATESKAEEVCQQLSSRVLG